MLILITLLAINVIVIVYAVITADDSSAFGLARRAKEKRNFAEHFVQRLIGNCVDCRQGDNGWK